MYKDWLEKPKNVFIIFVITSVFLVLLIYSNTFNSPFHYDDYGNIVGHACIYWDELSLDNLKKLFGTEGEDVPHGRPLALLTFALNYYYSGLNFQGYHAVNTAIHIISGIFLYMFIYKTLTLPPVKQRYGQGASWIAFISALLWLSSPVQTQAVTYIVQRMTSMAAMFYLLAFLFYIEGRLSEGRKRWVWWALVAVTFVLSWVSKPLSITLPVMIVIYEICFFQVGNFVNVFRSRLFYLVVVITALLTITMIFLFDMEDTIPSIGFGLKERIFTEARIVFYYVSLLVFPLPERMSLIYDYPLSRTLFVPVTTVISLVSFILLFVYALSNIRKLPYMSFFMIWVLITLMPEAFITGIRLIFEHRLYLPTMAFFPLMAIGGYSIWLRSGVNSKMVMIGLFFVTLTAFSVNTYMRNSVWKDSDSIYLDSVRKYPDSIDARLSLGTYYMSIRRYDDAIVHLEKAKELTPMRWDTYRNLGIAYSEKRLYDIASSYLERAIGMGDRSFDAYAALGNVYLNSDRFGEAEEAYGKALALSPNMELRRKVIVALEYLRTVKTDKKGKS